MLLRFFRGTGPGIVVLIFLIALGVWSGSLTDPVISSSFHYDSNPMPLYKLLRSLLINNPFLSVSVSFAMVLLLSILIVSFNTTVFFINERTFLPALLYILLTGLFPFYQVLNPALPAAVLIIIALMRIMESYRKNTTAFNFFDASVLIGLGSLFYANAIWLGLLAIIGIAILRTGNIKELLLAVLGLVTPLLLTAGIYYVSGMELDSLVSGAVENLFGSSGEYYFSRTTVASLVIIGIIVAVSIFFLYSVINTKKIKARKTFTLLAWSFIICIAAYFSLPSVSLEMIYIGAIPVSYFLAHYFIFSQSRTIKGLSFTAMLITIAVVQLLHALN